MPREFDLGTLALCLQLFYEICQMLNLPTKYIIIHSNGTISKCNNGFPQEMRKTTGEGMWPSVHSDDWVSIWWGTELFGLLTSKGCRLPSLNCGRCLNTGFFFVVCLLGIPTSGTNFFSCAANCSSTPTANVGCAPGNPDPTSLKCPLTRVSITLDTCWHIAAKNVALLHL